MKRSGMPSDVASANASPLDWLLFWWLWLRCGILVSAQLFNRELRNHLRLSIVEKLEVFDSEVPDGVPLTVAYDDRDGDKVHSRT